MARVDYSPVAGPEPTTAGTPGISENAPIGAFGGAVAGAEEQLGQHEQQAGAQLFQAGVQSQEFNINQQVKNTLFNEVGPEMDKRFSDYVSLKGKAAVDGYDPFMEGMAKLINDKAKGMSPYGQMQFLDNAHYLYQRIGLSASSHKGTQADVYDSALNNLAVQNLTNQGVLFQNDPPTVIKNGLQIRAQAEGEALKKGFAPGSDQSNATIADAVGGYYTKVISSKMLAPLDQGGGARAAQTLFDRVKPEMDAKSIDAMERMLHPYLKQQEGQDILGAALQGLGYTSGGAPGGGGGPPPKDLGDAVQKATAAHPGANADTLVRTAQLENAAGDPNAVSSTGARGYLQWLGRTAQQYGVKPGDAASEADGGARLQIDNRAALKTALGRDPTEAEIYLAHQQGAEGAAKLILHPDLPATVARGDAKAILANGGTTDQTAAQFVSQWAQKFNAAPGLGGGQSVAAAGNEGMATPSGWRMPDWSKVEQDILNRTQDDPEARQYALTQLSQTRQRIEMATATERSDLTKTFGDLEKAAEAGVPVVIPEDRIRAVFPPDVADRYVSALQVAQAGGQIMSTLKFASPQQLADAVTDLASGTGTYSDSIRAKLTKTLGGGAIIPPGGTGQEAPELYTMRTQMAAKAIQLIQQRQKAFAEDPAGYAAQEPSVALAAKAMDPKNPDSFGAYARATLAVQEHLGVRPEAQRVLTVQQADAVVHDLMQPGAETKQQLDGLAQQWGDAWTHVYSDLVTLGKMPAEMQGVAALPDPKDAALLARAIQEKTKSGKDWDELLGKTPSGPPVGQDIRNTVRSDTLMQQLERSWGASGATLGEITSMRSAIETLAYAKRFYNNDASAAQNAVKAFTDRYHFMPNGGARLPAAQADTIEQNAGVTLHNLSLDQIEVPRGFRTEDTDEARRLNPLAPAAADYLANLQANPTWITSPKGDALWLLDNGARLVRDKQGNVISVPFNAKAMETPPRALSMEPVPGGGATP